MLVLDAWFYKFCFCFYLVIHHESLNINLCRSVDFHSWDDKTFDMRKLVEFFYEMQHNDAENFEHNGPLCLLGPKY